ncbi:MAG: amidohydrolase family protein, partial [Cyclobacteriaceae bacterium]|nr:amidohydrolase family protein [Cyclobacteriaceae bacterium]
MTSFKVLGQLVDIPNRSIFPAEIEVDYKTIVSIRKINHSPELPFILPGFIDAHVHVESSMLVPSEFARLAVCHGT